MKSKKFSLFLTIVFCAFLTAFLVAHILLPDRDFSPEENRYLKQFSGVDTRLSAIDSGKFMEDFETYFSEQFPARDFWIGLKAGAERMTGKQENNGVYFGRDGQTLFAQYETIPGEEVEKRVGYVNALADKVSVPVYFSLIPGKVTVLSDLLPAGAPKADERTNLAQAEADCAPSVRWIDLTETMLAHQDEYVFYRTDHHWTTTGAKYAYEALMEGMDLPVVLPEEEPVLVSDDFLGTTYSAAGAKWVSPDEIYRPTDGTDVTVTTYYDGSPAEGSLYVEDKLETKDKYAYFLGGNQPLCVIETEHPDAPKLLVVRDSYSDCLAPFLTENFSEIHFWDLRYNNMRLSNYVEENGIDMVLVLYSMANFSTDSHLAMMGL